MDSRAAFINKVSNGHTRGKSFTSAYSTNVFTGLGRSFCPARQTKSFQLCDGVLFAAGLDSFQDDLINVVEVAALQLLLHQAFGFGFECDGHGHMVSLRKAGRGVKNLEEHKGRYVSLSGCIWTYPGVSLERR
jgi:hypothetical protein